MATNILDIADYVQDQGEKGRQRRVRDVLAGRAADAFTAETPDAQRTAVAEAIRSDPNSGFALSTQINADEDRRGRQIYNMARGLKSIQEKNPDAAAALYEQQLVPGLRRLGFQVQDTYDAARIMPVVDQVLAQFDTTGNAVQSTQIGADGFIYTIGRDGKPTNTGVRAAPTTQVVNQEGQVPFLVTTGRGQVGTTTAIGGSGPASSEPRAVPAQLSVASTGTIGSVDGTSDTGAPVAVSIAGATPEQNAAIGRAVDALRAAGTPDDQVDAYVAAQQARFTAPAAASGAPSAPAPARTPTAAETARATQDARNASDITAYDRMTNLVAQREAATTTARAGAEASAAQQFGTKDQREAASAARAKLPQLNAVDRGVTRIANALAALQANPLVGTGQFDRLISERTPEGQELSSAVAAIQTPLLSLTRVPGVGAQSDLEARLAAMQFPNLDVDEAVNANTLRDLRAFVTDLRGALNNVAGGAPGGSAPQAPAASEAAVPRATNPRTGETIEFRNGKWGPAR